jgi:hypothetical protein
MAACLRRPDLTQLVAAAVAAAAAAAMAYCTVHTVLYGCTHCALRMTMMVAASIHADGCMQIDITSAPHPVSASAACTESGRCKFSIGYNAPTGCSPHPFTLSVQEMAWLTSDGRTFDRACAPTCPPSLPPSSLLWLLVYCCLSIFPCIVYMFGCLCAAGCRVHRTCCACSGCCSRHIFFVCCLAHTMSCVRTRLQMCGRICGCMCGYVCLCGVVVWGVTCYL